MVTLSILLALLALCCSGAEPYESWTPSNLPTGLVRKTVFLIRHGESEWNEYQDKNFLWLFLSEPSRWIGNIIPCGPCYNTRLEVDNLVDVVLTQKGKLQSYTTGVMMQKGSDRINTLHQQEFLDTHLVASSPLRRPVQTAAYAVQHAKQMVLLPALREVRSSVNRDSVGHKTQELHTTYCDCLSLPLEMVQRRFVLDEVKTHPKWKPDENPEDNGKWWTPDSELTKGSIKTCFVKRSETDVEVMSHITEAMDWLRKKSEDKTIFSTHSHKIRDILKYLGKSTYAASKIDGFKRDCFKRAWYKPGGSAPNGSIIRLDLVWEKANALPVIIDGDFVYDPAWDITQFEDATPTFPSQHEKTGHDIESTHQKDSDYFNDSSDSGEGSSCSRWFSNTMSVVLLIAFAITLTLILYVTCMETIEDDELKGASEVQEM